MFAIEAEVNNNKTAMIKIRDIAFKASLMHLLRICDLHTYTGF